MTLAERQASKFRERALVLVGWLDRSRRFWAREIDYDRISTGYTKNGRWFFGNDT